MLAKILNDIYVRNPTGDEHIGEFCTTSDLTVSPAVLSLTYMYRGHICVEETLVALYHTIVALYLCLHLLLNLVALHLCIHLLLTLVALYL